MDRSKSGPLAGYKPINEIETIEMLSLSRRGTYSLDDSFTRLRDSTNTLKQARAVIKILLDDSLVSIYTKANNQRDERNKMRKVAREVDDLASGVSSTIDEVDRQISDLMAATKSIERAVKDIHEMATSLTRFAARDTASELRDSFADETEYVHSEQAVKEIIPLFPHKKG